MLKKLIDGGYKMLKHMTVYHKHLTETGKRN